MPELPEVETVRLGLAAKLVNAKVKNLEIFDARSLKRHLSGVDDFRNKLVGSKVLDVVRRGKFLWLPLDRANNALVGHLGMSGQMLLRKPSFTPDKLNRVTILFETQSGQELELRFVDQRIFGSLAIDDLTISSDGLKGGLGAKNGPRSWWRNMVPYSAQHIARDPLDEYFDQESVIQKLRLRRSGIKRILLDQNLLSGVGNIYADEALWRTRLHYDQAGDSISKAKAKLLMETVKEVLEQAVIQGGTSFDEQYKNVNGESGYFSQQLYAYGQTDLPCGRCQTPIRRDSWANRGSHYCPKCQRLSHRKANGPKVG